MDLSGFMTDPRLSGFSKALKGLWRSYVGGAKSRGLLFCLTPPEFQVLIGGKCWYCGAPPLASIRKKTKGLPDNGYLKYNGIDRVDSSENYTVYNTVTCCKRCNTMKMAMGLLAFLRHVDQIADHERDKKREYLNSRGIKNGL